MFFCLLTLVLAGLLLHALYEYLMRRPWISNIADKYVMVTGCDSGFGKALAQRLDTLGVHVLAGCLTQQGADQLAEACSSRLRTIQLDVSREESVKAALAVVTQHLPQGVGLHGLVNNAGISAGRCAPPCPEYRTRQELQEVLDVNLLGMADMLVTFMPLIKQAKGRIVNTSSMAGRMVMGSGGSYIISKFGVEALSDGARIYLRQYGVKVCIIEPGSFGTNILNTNMAVQRSLNGFRRIPESDRHLMVTEEEYENRIKNIMEMVNTRHANPDITPVVDAYTHALLSVHPKRRYGVGNDARFCIIPLSYAPSWLHDLMGGYILKQFPGPWKHTNTLYL